MDNRRLHTQILPIENIQNINSILTNKFINKSLVSCKSRRFPAKVIDYIQKSSISDESKEICVLRM